MKRNQKLYYIDISGKLYTYTVTNITETHVEVASDEFPDKKTNFTIEEAARICMKCSTLEDAQTYAERRKAGMFSRPCNAVLGTDNRRIVEEVGRVRE